MESITYSGHIQRTFQPTPHPPLASSPHQPLSHQLNALFAHLASFAADSNGGSPQKCKHSLLVFRLRVCLGKSTSSVERGGKCLLKMVRAMDSP